MAFGKSHRDPYTTSVGHFIEKATFAGAQTEDWGQFMRICDIINTTQDGPKDAVKALKKRISKTTITKKSNFLCQLTAIDHSNHTFKSEMVCHNKHRQDTRLILDKLGHGLKLLIGMCMQNCGPSFRSLIVKKEFIKDSLVKLLNPRYNLPIDIQNRILNFIKIWSQGFPGGVDVSEVKEVYLDLLKKGVQFPSSDAEAEARYETPQTSPKPPASVPTAPALSSILAPKNPTISLEPEQIGKLHSELDMVKMNVNVMAAILMENIPGSENHEDIELLQKLYKTGQEMQERIMDLLVVVENEDVTVELIQVNEDLNNAILGYERFTRNQQRFLEQNRNQKEATNTASEPSAPSCDLLDLSPSLLVPVSSQTELSSLNAQLSDLSFSSPSPVATNSLNYDPHLLVDLLPSTNTGTPLFAQRTSQNLASGHTYDNLLEHSSSALLQPVSLQTITAAPSNQRQPPLPSNHPVMANSDLQQSPNYYEVMEFDPLAPAVTTEAIYEEIDVHYSKELSHSDC